MTTYGEKYGGSWRKRAAVWKIPAQGEAGQASQFYVDVVCCLLSFLSDCVSYVEIPISQQRAG